MHRLGERCEHLDRIAAVFRCRNLSIEDVYTHLARLTRIRRKTPPLHGRRAPIVGRICMDQTIVDVTDIPEVSAGDTAVVLRCSGTESISVYDVAEQAESITNEILSRLGGRLERILL